MKGVDGVGAHGVAKTGPRRAKRFSQVRGRAGAADVMPRLSAFLNSMHGDQAIGREAHGMGHNPRHGTCVLFSVLGDTHAGLDATTKSVDFLTH